MATKESKLEQTVNNRTFFLQWHVTQKCDRDCKICYIPTEVRKHSKKDDLTLDESKKVLDEFNEFSRSNGFIPRVIFTGGHPLLRKDFFEILTYAKQLNMSSQILGNPFLLNDKMIEKLLTHGVNRYQLSFDGMEKSHDAIRGKGDFIKSTKALERLASHCMETVVMATVTKANQSEILQLPEYVINHGADKFDFARLTPTGEGANMIDLTFTAQEYKQFLSNMYDVYKGLINQGHDERAFGTKDNLWKLLLFEKGEFAPDPNEEFVVDGCAVGTGGFCMDSDGDLYGCRRIDDVIGNIRTSSVEDFMFTNPKMEEYRQIEKMEKCGHCELLNYCRGCPANAYADTGIFFGNDPQCWKED